MKIYIQTRGKIRDYTFLESEPKEKWWRKPVYEQGTSFEKPTLIIENDASEWRCYISGIPSNRRDRVNTPIRYTLVIEGNKKEMTENIMSLIFSAWQSFSKPSHNPLQKVLDDSFDFDLDELIDKKIKKDIDALLKKIIQNSRIQEFPINEKLGFYKKIKEITTKEEEKGVKSAVAFLNLVSSKDYINSDIQPAFKKSDINHLILIDSSGKMLGDLTNPPKEQNVPPDNTLQLDNKKCNEKKVWAIILVMIIAALAALILNRLSVTKYKSGNEYKTSMPSHTE